MAWLVLFALFCGHYLQFESGNLLSLCGSPAFLVNLVCLSLGVEAGILSRVNIAELTWAGVLEEVISQGDTTR